MCRQLYDYPIIVQKWKRSMCRWLSDWLNLSNELNIYASVCVVHYPVHRHTHYTANEWTTDRLTNLGHGWMSRSGCCSSARAQPDHFKKGIPPPSLSGLKLFARFMNFIYSIGFYAVKGLNGRSWLTHPYSIYGDIPLSVIGVSIWSWY